MRRRWFTGMAGLWLTAGLAWGAEPFPMPREGPLPFRRDRLPLDADTLRGLSRELVLLGRSRNGDTPEGRHAAAQSLALALALDPMNSTARETLENYREGRFAVENHSPSPRIRELTSWLESDEAGKEGRALALCLHDVLAAIELPGAPALQEGAWRGWVPELTAYRPVEAVAEEVKAPKLEGVLGPVLARRQGAIFAPLWVRDAESKREVFRKVKVLVRELPAPEGEDLPAASFRAELQGAGSSTFGEASRTLISVVEDLHGGNLPVARLALNLEKSAFPDDMDAGLSAAALVLIDATISGREPAGIVVGRIDKTGKLTSPPRLADRLLALSGGEGGRLILPREAEPLLPSIGVLAGPDFFLKYEVIYASNARELVERATAKPVGVAGEASEWFAEIRSKAPSSVGSYVANRFVRQRLAEVYQKFPDHASARLLWQQGGGEVPLKLVRPVIAAEIFRSLDALAWLTGLEVGETIQVRKLEQAQETCRSEMERLERYVATGDRALLDRYRDVLQTLRAFTREVRERNSDSAYYYDEETKRENALRDLKQAYLNFRGDLAKISE